MQPLLHRGSQHVMFLSTSTLSGPKPRMTSVAVSEKIRQWAATLKGDISGDDASKLRQEFIQYAEELEAELIESTFNV